MASILTAAQLAVAKQLVGVLTPHFPSNTCIAVCGNVAQECSFNPTLAGDGGASKYWMQWQGSRLTAYEAWCNAQGFPPTDPRGIGFFAVEVVTADGYGSQPQLPTWLSDTSNNGQPSRSLATLTLDICYYYERAGTPMPDDRIAYANQVAAYLNVVPPPNPAPSPTPSPTPIDPTSFAAVLAAFQSVLDVLKTLVGKL